MVELVVMCMDEGVGIWGSIYGRWGMDEVS